MIYCNYIIKILNYLSHAKIFTSKLEKGFCLKIILYIKLQSKIGKRVIKYVNFAQISLL